MPAKGWHGMKFRMLAVRSVQEVGSYWPEGREASLYCSVLFFQEVKVFNESG